MFRYLLQQKEPLENRNYSLLSIKNHQLIIPHADKVFVGKGVLHVQVFKKNDKRTIYNVVYRDGKTGP